MPAATPVARITLKEFYEIPDPKGARIELHDGLVVEKPFDTMAVMRALHDLRKTLEKFDSELLTVSPFYFVVDDSESRRLSLACVSKHRWNSPQIDDCFHDSPELAVEVVSTENTVLELRHKRKLCLSTGPVEFWLVHSSPREVEVYRADRELPTYRRGQQIPLFFAEGSSIPVDAIFA